MKKKPVQPGAADDAGSGIKLRCDYREEAEFEYWPRPTELQLAELAARLARTPVIDPKQLVGEAWAIYRESCRVLHEDQKHVTEFFENEGRWEPAGENAGGKPPEGLQWPVPKRYPVSYKEAELLLLPKLKGRTAERARAMRDYLFADYVRSKMAQVQSPDGRSNVSPTGEQLKQLQEEFKEVAPGLFGELRQMTFDKGYFAAFAEEFLTWYRRREGIIKSMVRADSARRGWEKRRQEKKARTGARPKFGVLRQIMESAAQRSLDGSKGREKA